MGITTVKALPNKRLKLAGALVSKEAVCLCAGGHHGWFSSSCGRGVGPAA